MSQAQIKNLTINKKPEKLKIDSSLMNEFLLRAFHLWDEGMQMNLNGSYSWKTIEAEMKR